MDKSHDTDNSDGKQVRSVNGGFCVKVFVILWFLPPPGKVISHLRLYH